MGREAVRVGDIVSATYPNFGAVCGIVFALGSELAAREGGSAVWEPYRLPSRIARESDARYSFK